MHTVQN